MGFGSNLGAVRVQQEFQISAIGFVRNERSAPEDDNWDRVTSDIQLDRSVFSAEAFIGLDTFSHVEIVFLFDRLLDKQPNITSRHPRGNDQWPRVGIFAQRVANRPNRLGVTICRIHSVSGTTLRVTGLDAIDGTPVLDIKPLISGFQARGDFREPDWAKQIMSDYWVAPEP